MEIAKALRPAGSVIARTNKSESPPNLRRPTIVQQEAKKSLSKFSK
jgi:hypothetical protein